MFDAEAVFAVLRGEAGHGCWLIAPLDRAARCSRCYRGGTGILETRFETEEGAATIIDFMTQSEEGEDTAIINPAAHLAEIETASAARGNHDKRGQQAG